MAEEERPAIWREVGTRVRGFRRGQRRSVDWLAEAVGLQRVQVVRIEAGLTGTTLERLARIAEVLGVTIDDLLPPRSVSIGDPITESLRGRGLSEQEIEKVLEYVEIIERARARE